MKHTYINHLLGRLLLAATLLAVSWTGAKAEETTLWEGSESTGNWDNNIGVLSDGGAELSAVGAKAGDVINFYGTPDDNNWQFRVIEGHWGDVYEFYGNATSSDSQSFEIDGNSVVLKIVLTEEILSKALTQQSWGNAFIVQGENVTLTKVTISGTEPYAALNDNNTVLTFFYDDKKAANNGMDVGPFQNADYRGWNSYAGNITKVVFDSSMDSYTDLTSTAFWFWEFTNLEEVVDIKYLHTDNVTSMECMFGIWGGTGSTPYTGKLPAVDMTHFNTSKVVNMNGVFTNCAALTTLDLSSFDTSSVTDMSTMFSGCTGLTTIYVGSGWTTANVTNGSIMFQDCTSLVGGAGTTFDASHTDAEYARIDGGPNSQTPGYFTAKSTAGGLEIYAIEKGATVTPNQPITATQSIIVTPGNDTEWTTDGNMGPSTKPQLVLDVSQYYGATGTYSFGYSMKGTNTPKDGELTTDESTGEVKNLGTYYRPRIKNLPHSGSYVVFETSQDGSLIIPIRVPATRAIYVTDGSGNAMTDIQIRDDSGNAIALLSEPLCAISTTEEFNGFVSFNAKQGEKYYVFVNSTAATRYGGYAFSPEAVTINPATMANVLDLVEDPVITDMEIFHANAALTVEPGRAMTPTQNVSMTTGTDKEWTKRFLVDGETQLNFTASQYYPSSSTTYAFDYSIQGTNGPKDGGLAEDGTNTGSSYDYTKQNLPQSGGFVIYEASKDGSLIIPFSLNANKPIYVVDANGKVMTDIQIKDASGQPMALLADPLCVISTTDASTGFLSFNVKQGEQYYVFGSGTKARFSGYVFKDQTIDIDPATMANVKDVLEGTTAAVAEPYAILSDDQTTLTFFYDDQKSAKNGMGIGPFSNPGEREWESAAASVTTVKFDESMANCTSLTSTGYWFYGFQTLTTVTGIGNLKTDNVTDMQYMFYDCNVLANIEVTGFNTANVTNMRGMFYKCQQLQTIDLSSFSTAKVTDVSWMFYNCNAMTTIYVGSLWALPEGVTDEDGAMFMNCTSLKGGANTTYDETHADASYARIDGGERIPGYLTDKNAVQKEDITVQPASGVDIAEAVNRAMEGKNVGSVTIELESGGSYTVNSTITVPGSLTVRGNNATVDASALESNMFQMVALVDTVEWTTVNLIMSDFTINDLNESLFYSNSKNYLFDNFSLDNMIVKQGANIYTFDFTRGSVVRNFTLTNSTYWAPNNVSGRQFYNSQGGQRLTDVDETATQVFKLHNNTMYNMAKGKNFFAHRIQGRSWQTFDVQNNIFVDCGKRGQVVKGLNGGQSSSNPTWIVKGNLFNFENEDTGSEETTGDAAEPVQKRVYGVISFVKETEGYFNGDVKHVQVVIPESTLGDPRWNITYSLLDPSFIGEFFAIEQASTITPNQLIPATQSVIMTSGNDAEWLTNTELGYWDTSVGSRRTLVLDLSQYYNTIGTYTYEGSMIGTNTPKDGELITNQETGEVTSSGNQFVPTYRNLPKSGAYVVYKALQDGSLIIPIFIVADKSFFVVNSKGDVVTDIQLKDEEGNTKALQASPLCSASEIFMGFVSFNVTKDEQYYIFVNGSTSTRYGGYAFSPESITIDPATMANVKSILDAEPYAVLSENNTVLTFYYDNQKETRGGFSIKDQGGSNTPTPSVDTNGTEAKPYTVEDAITVGSGTNVFVKAYIVGWIDGSTFGEGAKFNADATVASNIIIAATPDETDISKCMPVQLPSGAVRSAVNLQDNAGNYKKEILIVGNIEKYFGTTGVKSVSYAKIGNTEVGTKPDSGGNTPTPSGDNGTATAPLTVAQAIALIDAESNISEAYVKGKISQIDSYNATYKSITYWISDDGATTTQLQVYSGKGLNGADFNSKEDLTVGQTVVIKGALKMYSSVYEFDKNSSIISIDGAGSRQSGARRNRSSIITDYAETITKVVFDESFANYYPTSTASWFQGCTSLAVTSGIENLKTDNVTNMSHMFYNCSGLTRLDLSSFNTTNVTNMLDMFYGCSSLKTIYAGSGWSTVNVTEGGSMFYGCTSLVGGAGTTFDASHIDYTYARIDGGVDNPGYLTELIRKTLTADDYFEWNGMGADATKKSETPSRLCNYYIGQSAEVPYGDPNVSAYAYADLSAYDRLEITATAGTPRILLNRDAEDGYWNADESQSHQIESTQSGWSSKYFSHSGNVWTVDLKQIVADKGFAHLNAIKGDNWSAVTITKMELVKGLVENTSAEPYAVLSENNTVLTFFYDEKKAANNGMSVGPFSHYTDREWDNVASKITNVIFDSSFANATTLTSTAYWFGNCNKLESIEGIQNLNTANITTMQCMFTSCSSLSSLDVRNFNTDKVTNMGQMFSGCSALTKLDLSNFNTSNVTDMHSMFYGCSSLTSLDVTGFNTDNVTNMFGMFASCLGLTSLDLSNFHTQNVSDMSFMFWCSSGLTSLDLSSFNTQNVTDMHNMFSFCIGLKSLDLSSFNTQNVTNRSSLFIGCYSLASIQAGNAVIPDSVYAEIGNPNLLVYVNEASQAPQSVKNVVVLDEAEQIVLVDGEGNNNFYCPQEFTARRISYTHNYKQTTQVGVSRGWETIALPFDVQTIIHEKNGPLVPFGAEGGKPFWLKELTDRGLVSAQRIEANVPYLISMPNSVVYPSDYNQAGNVTFSATNVMVPATELRETSGNNRMLIPTMTSVAQSPDIYAINRNAPYENNPEGSIFVADYREVRPFEAYVEHTNGARFFTLSDLAEGDVTDIQAIRDIASADVVKVYNLSGVLLKTGKRQEVMSQLSKGIYIVNGVKVVVK